MTLLAIDGLTKRFRGLVAVDNVSLRVPKGSVFAIIGPNGAGKTTLFNLIAGVHAADAGQIVFDGQRIDALPADRICRLGLARTFQIVRPFPALTVHENVAIGAMLRVPRPAVAFDTSAGILKRVDLWDRRDQIAASLTLPDRKRLEVARALATQPKLLLLDEVMAGLRPTETDRVVEILRGLSREDGMTILMIEHVMRAVMALADQVHVLHHGASIAEGTPIEVTRDPQVISSYLGTEALG